MRSFAGRAGLVGALIVAVVANAAVRSAAAAPQATPSSAPAASPFPSAGSGTATPAPLPAPPANPEPDILTNPEPGSQPPSRVGGQSPAPPLNSPPAANPSRSAAPAAAASPAGRFHLHRPGTDVDGDLLTGSLASEVYVLMGDVTLHSDPTVDREIADASESTLPLTVTADEIDVDRAALTYVAKGHVHFVQGARSGSADVAVLDQAKHTLDLIGNADVREGDHRTAASKLHYNTADKGFLGAGEVRIYAPVPTPNPDASSTPAPKHKRRLPL